MEISRVRSSGAVDKGSDVHGVNSINDLRHEGFGCSMVEVKAFLGSAPNFFGGSNLGASGANRGKKRSWSRRSNPWDCIRQENVLGRRKNQAEMAIVAAAKDGRDAGSIGFQFVLENLETRVGGEAHDLRQHLVLKIGVSDVGDGGHDERS